jgi:hypothetical protein
MPKIERSVTVEGGLYKNKATGGIVTAVCWQKDGDHPGVVRYPIDGRDYKGLLVISAKEKYALKFGDWIVEDGAHTYIVGAADFEQRYEHAPEAKE